MPLKSKRSSDFQQPQFEEYNSSQDYSSQYSNKYDHSFLTDFLDEAFYEPIETRPTQFDNFNGRLSEDMPADIENPYKKTPGYFLRTNLDRVEWYEDEFKYARKKVANRFHKGDWVLVNSFDERGLVSMNRTRSCVGVIHDSQGNGWYVIKNLDGEWISAYDGETDMDSEITLIDFDKHIPKTASKKMSPNYLKRIMFVMRMYSDNIRGWDPPLMDDNKKTWMQENYEEFV